MASSSRSGSSASCSSPCSMCSCSASRGRSSATCGRRAGAGHRARPPRRPRLAGGRADPGREHRPRRDHDARPRREQRDRRRRPVRVGRARGPDVPRPGVVRRGPRQHERHVRQRRPRRGRRAARATATSSSWARSGCASSDRADDRRARRPCPASSRAIRPAAALARAAPARSSPRPRSSPAASRSQLARPDPASPAIANGLSPAEPLHLLVYLGVLVRRPPVAQSSPAAAPTRSCCRPSGCSAGSASC